MNRWVHVFGFAAALFVPAAAQAQLPPEKAASSFTVADGLEMKLWAAESLFVNPTCMDIDHRGRVWVCESVNYRNKLHGKKNLNRAAGDRIVILEDAAKSGKADKETTFYQAPDFIAPLGIAVAAEPSSEDKGAFTYKVYVCHSPDILVFEDKDGDGKADGPPKKLLTGFNGYDHDHGVHGIVIGPDGKLYFSVGDQGVRGLQSSDGKGRKWTSNDTDCRAGTVWRCDLDGKNLELLAHNFRNPYEPCVDSFGTVFISDNDDDGNQQTRICYVMPGGNYGYHPRGPGQSHWHEEQPGVVPKILRTYFGSPTGMCVYEGTLLPKKYWGQLLHTDAGPRHIRCYHLKPKGAAYEVEPENMVTSTDNWFRPSDVCVAPDGSVFIADWYDPGVGGHGMGDTTRGRIYRLAPKGNTYNVPNLDLTSWNGIRTALGSPNRAVHYAALAQLQQMKLDDAHEVMRAAIAQHDTVWQRARGLWLLQWLKARSDRESYRLSRSLLGLLAAVYSSKDERFREENVRLMREINPRLFSKLSPKVKKIFLEDPSPSVRRDVLLALRNVDAESAKVLILELAKKYDGKDRFYLEAIGIAVGHEPNRRSILLEDFAQHFPEWNDRVAGLVWELRPPDMMPMLKSRLLDAKVPADQRAQIVDILAASGDKEVGLVLLKALQGDAPAEVRERILSNLRMHMRGKWAYLRVSKDAAAVIQKMWDQGTLESATAVLDLIAAAEDVAFVTDVSALVRDAKKAEALRKAAVRTLGHLPAAKSVETLRTLLDDKLLAESAAESLGRLAQRRNDKTTAGQALQALENAAAGTGAARRTALSALAGTRPGSQWLLEQHAQKKLPADLVADAGRLLRNSPYVDLRNKALIAFPPPHRLDPKKLPTLAHLLERRGNPKRGKQLMAASLKNDMQCLKCHVVGKEGGHIGPDLSVIGKKASKQDLFESILDPSKAVGDVYANWQIETKKGLSLSGLIIEETPSAITLRDGNGKDTKIDKKDIENRERSKKSFMPDNLLSYMTEDDLVDLVAYLLELK